MDEIEGEPHKWASLICATIWNGLMMVVQTQMAEPDQLPDWLAKVRPASFENGQMEAFFNQMAKGRRKMTAAEMEAHAKRESERWQQR